ncbi:OmpA family protein [Citrifermentans bremense]|uniref:OmpA family protein n=1 Tax=Citrifermentans bremense TaxID=60035 RepID=UPI0004202FD1|nr:OmpA family protein [Citrifermentans bremense]
MKREKLVGKALLLLALGSVGTLSGCAHYEVNNGRGNIPGYWIRYEMQEADRAIEAARADGKAALCPDQFREAEAAKNNAYDVFRACHTEEGAALAKEATAKAKALCPPRPAEPAPKPVVAPPPPPPPAPKAPTDTLQVNPASVTKGETATLSWTSANASACAIEPEIGPVPTAGTLTITPKDDILYTLVCTGPGGAARSDAKVAVAAPPVPVPAPPVKLCQPAVINVHFDTNKSDIKPQYHDELKALAEFMKEFPNATGTIEGHTDSVGDKAANMKLSQRRADSVRKYLVDKFGIAPERVKAVGYGPTKPAADNKTAAGKQKNRRIESNFHCD